MKSIKKNKRASVILKDENTQLAVWNHSFKQQPTIGETIRIPARVQAALPGYKPVAVVSRIELRAPLPNLIEVAATCRKRRQDRPVIVLNSYRIPESLWSAAETYLRSTLRFPIIDWEPSNQGDPVVRFHDPTTGLRSCPADVRTGLLDMLYQPVSA